MDDESTWRSLEVEAGAADTLSAFLDADTSTPFELARSKKAMRALMSENERLRSVLGHCPKAIAVLDEHGNVTGFNRSFRELFGTPPTLGSPIARHLKDTDRELLQTVIRRAGTTKQAAAVIHTDGDRDVEILAATLPSSGDRSIGVVLAGEDRTALLGDEITSDRVHEANRRSAFELALSTLRGDIETTREAALAALEEAAERKDVDGASLSEARRALAAQGALLARIEPPRLSAPGGEGHVAAAAVRACRVAWRGTARRTVSVDVQIDSSLRVRVAEEDLVQILVNVLSDAVRAVSATGRFGFIVVSADEGPDGTLEISVRDDGVGLQPSRLQGCFTGQRTGGEDLGLSIACALVQRAGGTIRALSEPERGTTVVVALPAAERTDAVMGRIAFERRSPVAPDGSG